MGKARDPLDPKQRWWDGRTETLRAWAIANGGLLRHSDADLLMGAAEEIDRLRAEVTWLKGRVAAEREDWFAASRHTDEALNTNTELRIEMNRLRALIAKVPHLAMRDGEIVEQRGNCYDLCAQLGGACLFAPEKP